MRRARSPFVLLGLAIALTAGAAHAQAQEDCPLGSVQKNESGQTWCEPTVCETDTNCPTGSICRPVPLCVEIGVLDTKPGAKPEAEAGTKLLVRQRCGAGNTCPQRTTCSDKSRCITRAQAEKAGLLTVGSGSSAAAPSTATDPPKKACGCRTPGTRGGELGGGALALLGALAIAARRRTRRVSAGST